MRVLHVQRVSGVAGSERHLGGLLPALAQRGVDVKMVVLLAGEGHRFVDALRADGIPVAVMPAGFDVNPMTVARLTGEIRSFEPDLVHTHLIHGDTHGQLAARLAAVPGISSFHASPPLYRRQPYRSAAVVAARLTRLTIAISKHLREFLVANGLASEDRVRVIHYGIDAEAWMVGDEARAKVRAHLGLHPSEIAVGVASRLVPDKGHADLIDGFAVAARRRGNLRLLIAGTGPLREQLERRARAALPPESFRFLGFVEDMRSFNTACDMFVFPTTPNFGEGFGMAALEAAASGCPVIGTSVGPIPEVVADGESGLVVPASSPEHLADAMVALASDAGLRRQLGEGGKRRARLLFSVDRMVDRTLDVYEEAIRMGPR